MGLKRLPASAFTEAPDRLPEDARKRIRDWAVAKWPQIEKQLGNHWAECRDWHLANGVLRRSWEAAFRTWLRTGAEWSGGPPRLRSQLLGQRREPR